MTVRPFVAIAAFTAAAAVPLVLMASPVPALTQFQAGQSIRAADFNANFQAIKTSVDDNDRRIGNLSTLQTSNKSDLVVALNEVRSAGVPGSQGPAGATGPAGPTGPTRLIMAGFSQGGAPGAGTNTLAAGSNVFRMFQDNPPAGLIAGKPWSCTVRLQTVSSALGGDNPGAPTTAGTLTLDMVWLYYVDSSTATVTVAQNAVGTVVLDPGVNNNKVFTFTGTVPATPSTPGGLVCNCVANTLVRVNAGSAVNGQFAAGGWLEITLP
jgi:hypothetical protein